MDDGPSEEARRVRVERARGRAGGVGVPLVGGLVPPARADPEATRGAAAISAGVSTRT